MSSELLISGKFSRRNIYVRNIYNKQNKPIYHTGGYKLPNTMDFSEWPNCEFTHDHRRAIIYKHNSNIIY